MAESHTESQARDEPRDGSLGPSEWDDDEQ